MLGERSDISCSETGFATSIQIKKKLEKPRPKKLEYNYVSTNLIYIDARA